MNSRRLLLGVLTGAIALAVAASGCSSKKSVTDPKTNQRPILELTRAPFNESTRFEYSYRMNWLGYDPDGRVEYYLYAIDPPTPTPANPEPETTWVQTTKSERLVNFSATRPDSSNPAINGSSDFHTFVVKAIDNGGLGGPLQSAPLIRSFFTYTIAPTVQILDPPPTDRGRTYTPPSVRISWTGTDEDGILDNKKPVKYKYILLTQNSPVPFQVAKDFPDSVRRYYAPRNWAGWDSTTADTTSHQFTNLVPGQDYMFVVVAFDEAGAYSPVFSLNSNMLELRITYAASGGPLLTLFNEFFFYEYVAPVYAPTIDRYIVKVEVPAGQPVTFNWAGVASAGALVRGYRWALDIDEVSDQTPRTNERTDLAHWSQESGDVQSATVGPFAGGEIHHFYVEAADNNGLKSLGVIRFLVVQSTLEKPLLIVDDTRFSVDTRTPGTTTCVDAPKSGTRWPNSAELDTFLYARGNFPYKCYPAGTLSKPGLFNGYPFDTVGTRTGQSVVRVPLATLGNYAHVIWIIDQKSALKDDPGTSITESVTALRYMSRPGQANSLAAYIKQGGQVWLVGGGGGYATTQPYNKVGNDLALPAASPTYSGDPAWNELVPGRFMYDLVHWQSEFKSTSGPIVINRFRGRYDAPGDAPENTVPTAYARLPEQMRGHSTTLGDELPPLRRSSDYFYSTFEIEYLSKRNDILEDVNPSPVVFDEQSTLDTLYYGTGQVLVPPSFNAYNVCMTRYIGSSYAHPILFSGFNFWQWSKVDCQALIDAVLVDMWGFAPRAAASAAMTASRIAPAWSPTRIASSSTAAPSPLRTSRTSGNR